MTAITIASVTSALALTGLLLFGEAVCLAVYVLSAPAVLCGAAWRGLMDALEEVQRHGG